MTVDYFGMDVRTTLGESALSSGRIILLVGRPHLFYASLLSSILLHFAPEQKQLTTSRFVGPVISDKGLKLGDPRLNLSREIPPEAV